MLRMRQARKLGPRLVFRRSSGDGVHEAVLQSENGPGELAKSGKRRGRREDGERVLEGRLLPEGNEGEAEQREQSHEGFGDAASR